MSVAGLEPELVWKYFAAISCIPRGSNNEAAVAEYVLKIARGLGLQSRTDAAGNVLVKKPASTGRENRRSVALQGHLDMVCEKNRNKEHDFLHDPIRLVRKGNIITADGTTLGADNGIAVAINLAIMEEQSLQHGPLELLFTVNEETGLTGAAGLSPDFLESRILLNLDSEEEGTLFTGCAGGKDTIGAWKFQTVDVPESMSAIELKVTGLRGGHSGMDIDKGRGNAIKIMNRALRTLDSLGVRLAAIEGGDKHNAIPRECEALLWIAPEKTGEAIKLVENLNSTIRAELAGVDSGIVLALIPAAEQKTRRVLKEYDQKKLMQTLSALPHGVIRMSADIAGLVETSTNLAVIRMEGAPDEGMIRIVTFQRSSTASALDEIADSAASVFELGGAAIERTEAYPGWKPDMNSEILKIAKDAWRVLFNREPKVMAVHAGLECGMIGDRIPGIDMISFGPDMEGAHSPDECIYIDSVERIWHFLLEILARI